jgi:hypothetical protein
MTFLPVIAAARPHSAAQQRAAGVGGAVPTPFPGLSRRVTGAGACGGECQFVSTDPDFSSCGRRTPPACVIRSHRRRRSGGAQRLLGNRARHGLHRADGGLSADGPCATHARHHRRRPAGPEAARHQRTDAARGDPHPAPGHCGDRDDSLRHRHLGSRSDAHRRHRLPDQALHPGGGPNSAGARQPAAHLRSGQPDLSRSSAQRDRHGRPDRPLPGHGEALPHFVQGGSDLPSGADPGREWRRQGGSGAIHSPERAARREAFHPSRLRVAGTYPHRK